MRACLLAGWLLCRHAALHRQPPAAAEGGGRSPHFPPFTVARLRRHEEAVADCTKTIELDALWSKGYVRRALALSALGGKENLQRALADFNKAKEVLPTDQKSSMDSQCVAAPRGCPACRWRDAKGSCHCRRTLG